MISSFFTGLTGRPLLGVYLALAIAASGGGCATIARGTTYPVMLSSTIPGAKVLFRGDPVPLPCVLKVPKSYRVQNLYVYADGYHCDVVQLHPRMTGWIFGNLLFGGAIGVLVDSCTAAHMEFREDNVQVDLAPATLDGCREASEARWAAAIELQRRRPGYRGRDRSDPRTTYN